jgi:hypothetical protein
VLGAAAGILLVVGLLRVFFFEKGADYYFHSHAFMTKFSIFIAVALLSIVPTLEFLSWRKALRARKTPISECGKAAVHPQDHPWRVGCDYHHIAVCRDHGARRVGLETQFTATPSSRPYGMTVLAVFDSNWRQQAKQKFIPKRVVA